MDGLEFALTFPAEVGMTAQVSVLVLTYNHERFIKECLDGIFNQIAPFEFEVVVHDDLSTDGTRAILKTYEELHPTNLKVNYHEYNYFSTGRSIFCEPLLSITTPYVAFCEGDDFWTDRFKLAKQMNFMTANPWCSISHHAIETISEGGNSDYFEAIRGTLNPPQPYALRTSGTFITAGNYLGTASVMLRRSSLRDEFLRKVNDIHPEDWLVYALAAENGDIGYMDQLMACYRLHGKNAWADMDKNARYERMAGVRRFLLENLVGPSKDAALFYLRNR